METTLIAHAICFLAGCFLGCWLARPLAATFHRTGSKFHPGNPHKHRSKTEISCLKKGREKCGEKW